MQMPTEITDRYLDMLSDIDAIQEPEPGTSLNHLKWMINELTNDRPWGKQRGWLGFIQYGLVVNGYTTVTAERDFTRPFFSKLDNMKE